MASSTHVVVRAFPGPGGILPRGTEVDASGWRNAEMLTKHRFIQPIGKAVLPIATPARIDEAALVHSAADARISEQSAADAHAPAAVHSAAADKGAQRPRSGKRG